MTDPVLSTKTDNGRYYIHPNKQSSVPSITNIKGVKTIEALKYFYTKECAGYAADGIIEGRFAGLSRDEVFSLVKGAPFRQKPIEENPSKIGDIIHGWIDQDIKRRLGSGDAVVNPLVYIDSEGNEKPAPRTARNMWRQYDGGTTGLGFNDKYNPKWIASEFTVWSDTYGYAGTADWSAQISNTLVLGDNKSGKSAYSDVGLQLGALANADYILDADGTQHELPKFERFMVLHIRPMFYRPIPVVNVDEAFKAFLGLKACFDWMINFEDKTLKQAPKTEVRVNAG